VIDPRHFAASDRGLRLSIPKLLFAVLGAPLLWALHLSAVYFLVTLDCISAWDGGIWSVLVVTVLLGAGSVWAGWTAWSIFRRLGGEDPSAGEWEWARFLLVLGIGASVIFTAVIVLEGVSPLLAELCA
jgi:hypothetical protein